MKAHNRFILSGIVVSSVVFVSAAHSQTWKQLNAPITNWVCVASSATGSNLFAAARGSADGVAPGPIYRSDDAGATWTQSTAPITNWTSIACSGDGSVLIGSAESALFVSTDSGATWVERTPESIWTSFVYLYAVAASADGQVLVAANSIAAAYNWASQLFVSTNQGSDWTMTVASEFVQSVACSGNGRTALAGAIESSYVGSTYVSTNYGQVWTENYASASTWQRVACSADGGRQIAIGNGLLWLSLDGGATWQEPTNPDMVGDRASLAISASAEHMVLAFDANLGGAIFASSNTGLTWSRTDAPITNWTSVASSADASQLVACSHGWPNGGQIYMSRTLPRPTLSIVSRSRSMSLSWLVPSLNFVLQQNPDLSTTNWTDVTAKPSLNYTNLNYEVTVAHTVGAMFYKLASR